MEGLAFVPPTWNHVKTVSLVDNPEGVPADGLAGGRAGVGGWGQGVPGGAAEPEATESEKSEETEETEALRRLRRR